jgi:oxepin-CoA hydrolase/3-oxo-5,6-dehydrosuberyl-CoA semialdehyde dehydrogenase
MVINSAITDLPFARVGGQVGGGDIDAGAMVAWAKDRGGKSLRAMTLHQRGAMLKALAQHLNGHKQALYDLSFHTGATQADHVMDVDGAIGTLFVYASKARREMNDGHVWLDGPAEQLARDGSFQGTHIRVPRQGVGVHINAFNFPVWGMIEKLAATVLAGVPAIVKPARATCYVSELAFRIVVDSGILPTGSVQLLADDVGDLLGHLGAQDVVSFTGSALTAQRLRADKSMLANGVRLLAEQDSLNAAILGWDAVAGSPEYNLFLAEALHEMTAKAGQKCTAMRRLIVPATIADQLADDLADRLKHVVVGDPRLPQVQMGALVNHAQRRDVAEKIALLTQDADVVLAGNSDFTPVGEDAQNGSFMTPTLLMCATPDTATSIHETEAFGPVATIVAARDTDHAIALANQGGGALVTSLFSHDTDVARQVVLGAAPWHGRIYINNRDSAAGATGHGAPVPHLVHGGPGRAGGSEELGGLRALIPYMQRTAIQGSPEILSHLTGRWHKGAPPRPHSDHPFTRTYGDLKIGDVLMTQSRQITLEDIDHFAHFTGDTFYAHMDADAARRNPFFPDRVAHGYLLLSFAAGLFVDPNEGPVLANTGLDNLRFLKPVVAGDSLSVQLVVAQKTPRTDTYGEVRWAVTLTNQQGEPVATYELLTMNAI